MSDDLTKFRLDCLAAIGKLSTKLGRGPSGQEIQQCIEDHYGADVRHPRLYGNLDDLYGMALVEKGEHDGRTNAYELTLRGKRELVAETEWYLRSIDGMEVAAP